MRRHLLVLTLLPGALLAFAALLPSFARAADVDVSGNISTNTTWSSSNTYYVSANVTVDSGVTLTIDPGTIVKFDSFTRLVISGGATLVAEVTFPPDPFI